MSTLKLPDGTLAEDVHEWRRVRRRHIKSQPGFSRLHKTNQRIAIHVVSVQGYAIDNGTVMAEEGEVARALGLSRRTVIRALRVPDPKRGRAPGAIIAKGVLGADSPRWETRSKRRLPNVYSLPGVTVVCHSALSQESASKSTLYVENPSANANGNGNGHASAPVVVASALDVFLHGASSVIPTHTATSSSSPSPPADASLMNGNGHVVLAHPVASPAARVRSHGPKPISEMTLDELDEEVNWERLSYEEYHDELERRYPLTPESVLR